MSAKLDKLPQEVQALVTASIASAGAAAAHVTFETPAQPQASEAPNTDTDDGGNPTNVQNAAPATTAKKVAPQAKSSGTSLLRKVSNSIAAGPRAAVQVVGGPRKMGGPRIFGGAPYSSNVEEAKNRWKSPAKKDNKSDVPTSLLGNPLDGGKHSRQATAESQMPQDVDPLVEALEGFEAKLADEEQAHIPDNEQMTILTLGYVLRDLIFC